MTGAQTSLDAVQLRKWISNSSYGGHAFGFAAKGRSRAEEFELLIENRERVLPWIREYSPIELVSKDDPPFFLDYPNQKTEPVLGGKEPDPTHSAIYGIEFSKKCKEEGVACIVSYPGNKHADFDSSVEFLIKKLSVERHSVRTPCRKFRHGVPSYICRKFRHGVPSYTLLNLDHQLVHDIA